MFHGKTKSYAAVVHELQVESALKKCWVKYNLALGKIWMNPAIGLFRPSGWITAQKVGLNI